MNKTICGKPILFTKEFKNNGEAFSAYHEAETFLKSKGFSLGSMQREAPIGIVKGDIHISKWRNLSPEDILNLDGAMTFNGGSPRSGDVVIHLNTKLEEQE